MAESRAGNDRGERGRAPTPDLPPGPDRKRVVWLGRIATRRGLLARAAALAAPGLGWILVFLVLPSLLVAVVSLTTRDPFGRVDWSLSLDGWKRVAGFGTFGWSADVLRILLRSLRVASATTALSLLLAYPLAFFLASRPARTRAFWLALVLVPLMTNLVVRTYAFELLLSPGLPPARIAAALGLVEPGRALYPSELAVLLGMVSNALPFATLPLYTNVTRLDPSLVDAARDLYSGPVRVFLRAVLPQTRPGLGVAIVLTFVPATGMFVVTDRLGGANFMILGNLIQQQFGPARNYPFGAAVTLVVVVLTLAGLALYRRRATTMELL